MPSRPRLRFVPPLGILLTLVRAMSCGGYVTPHHEILRSIEEDPANSVHRFVDSGVDVALVERVGRGGEDTDAVDTGRHRGIESPGIRHQPEQPHPIYALDTSQDFGPVGHLGHRLGAHEGHRVEMAQAGGSKVVYQARLGRGGHEGAQRLETVTRG